MPKETRDRPADTHADLEQDSGNAPLAANGVEAFTSQVCLTFYHTRKRVADLDGLSVKAAIDGLVAAGVLATDSPKQVAEIRVIQTQGSPEETKIVIEEIAALPESEARDG